MDSLSSICIPGIASCSFLALNLFLPFQSRRTQSFLSLLVWDSSLSLITIILLWIYSSSLQHGGKTEKTGAEESPESMRPWFAEGGWGRGMGHEFNSVLQKVKERSHRWAVEQSPRETTQGILTSTILSSYLTGNTVIPSQMIPRTQNFSSSTDQWLKGKYGPHPNNKKAWEPWACVWGHSEWASSESDSWLYLVLCVSWATFWAEGINFWIQNS